MIESREIRLKARPRGEPRSDDFELARVQVPPPSGGQVQVRNRFISVDPYMRGRLSGRASFIAPFQLGAAMEGGAVGEVIASAAQGFTPGDTVLSMFGWREVFTATPEEAKLQRIETRGFSASAFLGVLGLPGLAAYLGLMRIAGLQAGETAFVTAAAGAVGHVACQIARVRGARVIGSAGGPEKVRFLRALGVDHVIDYRASGDLTQALLQCAPAGIDVCLDNVGGAHLEAALVAARPRARIALCGAIAMYRDPAQPSGLSLSQIIRKDLRLEGFMAPAHAPQAALFLDDMQGWMTAGRMTGHETVFEGIEQAPAAFLQLFEGGNIGKMLVRMT